MTMGNDMSSLHPDVVACMSIPVLEVKKMVYLFLINYAKGKPEMALEAINTFRRVNHLAIPSITFHTARWTVGLLWTDD